MDSAICLPGIDPSEITMDVRSDACQSYSSQLEKPLDTHQRKTGYTNDHVSVTQTISVVIQHHADPHYGYGNIIIL